MAAMAIDPASFTGVDLSRLPAPTVVEALDYPTIRAQAVAQFEELCVAAGIAFDATVESDPVVKLLELFAWRELQLRARVNDAARAVMVAYAMGPDLDALGALFEIERAVVTAANPLTGAPAVLESDDAFRRRMVLAPEGFSVAGPAGAYVFHALSASVEVADATAISPEPGEVVVTVLGATGNGVLGPAVLDVVDARLNADTVRPITDLVTVQAAEPVEFAIAGSRTFRPGPDKTLTIAASDAALADYLAASRRLGRAVTRAGLTAALMVEGLQNVVLTAPPVDVVPTPVQFARCTGIALADAGYAA